MGAMSITRLGPHLICGIIFVAYAAASILWSSGNQPLVACWLVSLVGAFIIGYSTQSVREIWLGAIILSIVTTVASQASGLAINPNYLGAALAISLAGAIAYNHWWAIPILTFEIYLTQSRTALLAGGATCLLGLWQWSKFWAMCLALLALLFVLHQKSDGSLSAWSRLGIWQDTMEHFTIFGKGFGSYLAEYSTWPVRRNMTLQLAPHAYNDTIELLFELGIGAIALWCLILGAWEHNNPSAKLVCLTFLVLSLTHFPLSIPLVAHLFALSLGHLSNQRFERKSYGRMSTMASYVSPLSQRSRHPLGTE